MKGKKAKELYEDFHGYISEKEFDIELEDVENLTLLGRAVAIEYEAMKHGDTVKEIYRHDFGSKAILLTNGKDLIVFNPEMSIEDRGIVG